MMTTTEFDFTQIFADERLGFLSTIHKESGAIQKKCRLLDLWL